MDRYEELSKEVNYDKINGKFTWKEHKKGRKKDLSVGSMSGDGRYLVVGFKGKTIYLHRLAFFMCHGFVPESVDHVNHNGTDNRERNLREVDQVENLKNTSMHRHNTSGFNGVSYYKQGGKYEAYLHVKGKKIKLGMFNSKLDAIAARIRANKEYGFHKNHGGQNDGII